MLTEAVQEAGSSDHQHERQVLDFGGVVARYGQLYGPGTFSADQPPQHPPIQVDDAARATPALLDAASGIVTIAESR